MIAKSRLAVVTGANRGIGLEVARQLAEKGYHVVLAARDLSKGRAAAEKLTRGGSQVEAAELDVSDAASISRFAELVATKFGRLDVLVNNAGVFLDSDEPEGTSAFQVRADTIRNSLETNVFGPFQLMQKLLPVMRKAGYGRVVNVSSGMGQLTEMNGGYPAYRVSKTALNALTRIFSEELQGTGVLVNSACPGWVKTDMGGPNAERSVEEGADTIVWLATLPEGGPTGGFFRDRERIEW
jgi:NAD(P)-dependent dehydrogenase (short-subunit alcohol dehydrogenase family)